MRARHRLLSAVVALATTTALLAGCSLGPDDLPSPTGGVEDGFPVDLEFTSALNLPNGANVTFDGLDVGRVTDVRASGQTVNVTATIRADSEIPSDAEATIRQDTVLGDTYVAIDRSPGSTVTSTLRSGATIPVSRTTSPPQLEDTLAVLANFVNGGNIQKIEDTIRRINRAVPVPEDLVGLSKTVAIDLRDLSKNLGRIDGLLAGLDRTATAVESRHDKISAVISDHGVEYWDQMAKKMIQHLGTILPSVGSIFAGGGWLVPMLKSLATTINTVKGAGVDFADDSARIDAFLTSVIVPFSQRPSVDLVSVTTPDGRQLADMRRVLRMLGAVR
ncbi:MlaD family protein [Gordonia shandongensis]|uniref:MlaD family protein n=1 Tax=Gordonia shandongensis TaxID=376351 RepID=UPI0003FE33D3|nr:MlaD family protein [Gordonia shandongensis]